MIVAGTNAGRHAAPCVPGHQRAAASWPPADGELWPGLPLPVAGRPSVEPFERGLTPVGRRLRAAHVLGCDLASPFGTLSFLALPVIPELHITDQGLFDVAKQEFLCLGKG